MNKKAAVITCNDVQKCIFNMLKEKGVSCESFDSLKLKDSIENIKNYDTLVLPFPSDNLKFVFLPENSMLSDFLSKNQTVIGGMISNDIKSDLENAQINYIDYFENEAYVLKNAYLTSQGALRLLLEKSKKYLPGSTALVCGFGRIGKSLAMMLKAIGLKVYITARSEKAVADASSLGFDVLKISSLKSTLFYFDFIFNTIPSVIFSCKDVEHIRSDSIYFELASSPYGADAACFEYYEKNYVLASALPGKLYPEAVAKNITEYILFSGGD